ncbi:GDSL-like Lipase/Acylhydrolase [Rubripirellula lacrimiformis]|uniref:GDSL-like Lipase/Acylhydrolase n=1 Tax=Rubripirellula lacrimiformis TaxID=1930273 RepID=A0A517NFP7_9BACT|nr:GDSL-type esterase/lipase family protein [Rubripirellula lacrimiformis]QDT05898.1 GDSL-like Lipase/Acylhydrolase [Rubripirellula lacrimiformis]
MRFAPVCFVIFSLLYGTAATGQTVASEKPVQQRRFEIPATNDEMPGTGPVRRYDWMKNLWDQRRSTFADRVEQDKGSIVFFGDSITQGWTDDFRGRFDALNTPVANRGISGDTTRGMLYRIQGDVLDLDPAAVVMLMGTNDLEEKADADSVAGNVERIIGRLNQHNSEMPIVLCLVMPSSETKSRSAKDIQAINAKLLDTVRGNPQVTVVDTWTLFAGANGDAKKEEFPDLLHPNAIGYEKWTAALMPLFATLGFVDASTEAFQVEDGFTNLFNGKDLTGWGFRTTPAKARKGRSNWIARDPSVTWPLVEKDIALDGMTASPDNRFRAIDGRLVVTTPPEGRKIQQLYTTQDFAGDFTLKLEFRAGANADSGVFLCGHQLQVRDFPLAGPYKKLKDFRPFQWNELVVVARDGKARCTCNGEVLEDEFDVPAKGPIGLEGDRGQIEYRRIRLRNDS